MNWNAESSSDDEDFNRAVNHAQMMRRQRYKQECKRRQDKMEFNERTASMALAASKAEMIQDALRERNKQSELDKQLKKERRNSEFWHRVMNVLIIIAIAVVIYTLIHFSGQ